MKPLLRRIGDTVSAMDERSVFLAKSVGSFIEHSGGRVPMLLKIEQPLPE